MSRDEAPALRPVLLVIVAMFAFSLMVVFTRAADANILGVAAWRAIVVALVFAASAALREGGVGALRPDPITLKLGTWLGIALAVASSTFVGAYALTTAANTIFLHNLAPVFVFPLAWWLFKERSGSAAVTGAIIALFGVALLSGVSLFQVSHFASSRFLLGDFLAFVSAIGYAAVLGDAADGAALALLGAADAARHVFTGDERSLALRVESNRTGHEASRHLLDLQTLRFSRQLL